MSFLRYDSKEAGGSFEPIPEADYECIISEVEVTTAQSSGNPMIKLVLIIRADVEQEGQKRKIFDNLVATEKAMFKFHQYSKALGFEEGQEFETLEEFAEAIAYQPVIVHTKNEEYNGKLNPKVHYLKPSEVGTGDTRNIVRAATGADPFADDGRPIDISDDDLPF